MNWMLIDGLERNGLQDEAARLRGSTIDMISKGGLYEYFSPINAEPAGADGFSWTAALLIDMLAAQKDSKAKVSK
jgi:hypothetical protein